MSIACAQTADVKTSKQSFEHESEPGHLLRCVCLQALQLCNHKLVKLPAHHSTGVSSIVILGVTMVAAEKWRHARQSKSNAAGRRRRGISCLLTPAACHKGTLILAFMACSMLRLRRGNILTHIDDTHADVRVWYLTGMAIP